MHSSSGGSTASWASVPASEPAAVTTPAFLELQRLVRHMTDELASFRRRAFAAEGRVRELEQALVAAEARADEAARGLVAQAVASGGDGIASSDDGAGMSDRGGRAAGERVGVLERENATLRQRLDGAAERTRQLLERVRFLRQQQQQEAGR